jgi:hypothetical protein
MFTGTTNIADTVLGDWGSRVQISALRPTKSNIYRRSRIDSAHESLSEVMTGKNPGMAPTDERADALNTNGQAISTAWYRPFTSGQYEKMDHKP